MALNENEQSESQDPPAGQRANEGGGTLRHRAIINTTSKDDDDGPEDDHELTVALLHSEGNNRSRADPLSCCQGHPGNSALSLKVLKREATIGFHASTDILLFHWM